MSSASTGSRNGRHTHTLIGLAPLGQRLNHFTMTHRRRLHATLFSSVTVLPSVCIDVVSEYGKATFDELVEHLLLRPAASGPVHTSFRHKQRKLLGRLVTACKWFVGSSSMNSESQQESELLNALDRFVLVHDDLCLNCAASGHSYHGKPLGSGTAFCRSSTHSDGVAGRGSAGKCVT